jgi:hypothetical protein
MDRCRCMGTGAVASKKRPQPGEGDVRKRTSGFRRNDLPNPEKELITLFAAFSAAPTAPAASTASRRRYEAALKRTNIWRERKGIPPLTFSASSEAPAARTVPHRRHKDALDQISIWRERNGLPRLAGECLKKCDREIDLAVISVEFLKEVAPWVITPKDYRTIVKADAEKLREVALHGYGISEELLHMLDNRADAEQQRVVAMARDEAVRRAERLLKQFADSEGQYHADNKDPELTKDGLWDKLSYVLFGVAGADMWGAMQRCRRARDKARASRP